MTNAWHLMSPQDKSISLLCSFYADELQEEFSDEEDGQDEDLSAALATLRMQQEARTKDGGSKRPGQEAGGKGGSVGDTGGDGSIETAIRTQVSYRLEPQ